jgi:hypothetical protein
VLSFASAWTRCDAAGQLVDGTPDGYLMTCLVCRLIVDMNSFDPATKTIRVVGEASAYGHIEPAWPPRDDALRGTKVAIVQHGGPLRFVNPDDVLVAVFSHDRRLAVTAAIRLVARRTGRIPPTGGPLFDAGGWWSITEECRRTEHHDDTCWTWREPDTHARSWCGQAVPPGTPGAVPVYQVRVRDRRRRRRA